MAPLSADRLVELAATQAGTDDGGAPTWREGLEVLVDSLNREARLSELGQTAIELQLTGSLAARFAIAGWRRDHPELDAERIARPIVVAGLPRTGTTLLSYLLDCDPANRSLLHWEARNCVPPPTSATLRTDPRIEDLRVAQEMLYTLAPGFKAQHHEEVTGPTECVQLLSEDCKSLMYETLAYVPSYSRWLVEGDYASAYDWHHRALQHLQSAAPGRWSLKSPEHCRNFGLVTQHYPDARLVMTHRDPVAVCASLTSLVTTLNGVFCDDVDPVALGRQWVPLLAGLLHAQADWRADHPETLVFDLDYADLVRDPVGSVRALYRFFGEELSVEAAQRMQAHIDAHPQHEHGPHRYRIEDYGVTEAEVRDAFQR